MPARLAIILLALAPALRAEEGPALVLGEAQLAPHFSTGPLKQAVVELEAGRGDAALKLLPQHPKDAPTRWLKALSLKASGRFAAARKTFEQLAIDGGPLADRALHFAALAALDGGDARSAERLLAQVPARYVDADQAILERARQLMSLKRKGPATARLIDEVLKPIFDGAVRADSAAAFLVSGDAWREAGDKETARDRYRAAWVDRPLSGAADSARQREKLLGPGPLVAPERLVKRAEILLEAHRNHDAYDQLARIPLQPLCAFGCPGDRTPAGLLQAAVLALAPDALPEPHQPTPEDVAKTPANPADPLACRAKLDQGRALRKEHEYTRARAALAPVVLRCGDEDVRARALFLLAQLETMAGRPTAGPLWEALARKFPNHSLADDAIFNHALSLRRAGNPEAERAMLKTLVETHLDADMRAEGTFRLFWSYQLEGKGRQGLPYLDQLAAWPDTDGAEEERARYWRARVLLVPLPGESPQARATAREAARADLTWLVEERPLGYHGLLARGWLAELDPQRSQAIEAKQETEVMAALGGPVQPLRAGPMGRDPHFVAGLELIRLGLRQEAVRELNAVERAPLRNQGDLSEQAFTLLADLYSRAGDPRNAHAVVRTELRRLLRRPGSLLGVRAAALAYPLAFRDQIAKVAQTASVPTDLLQALMREESALDPRALSSTGALGLTQVMPATARDVARKLRLRGYQTSDLLEPNTNIRIGGAYLGELLKRFQHPALALASYNAGPGIVAGWMRSRGSLSLDAFVEEIPLDETRGYVKRCLRSYAAYQFLYARGPAPRLGQTLAVR